jgi:uncharacterized membrane protein YbhN (UPF0104 family)
MANFSVRRHRWRQLTAAASRPAVGWAAKLAVSAVLIALVCRNIDVPALIAALAGQSVAWIAATAALGLVQIALLGLRWQLILKALGAESGLRSTLAVTFMGCFFGAFLVGPTGGDVARAMLAPRCSLGRAAIVHSVLFERIASVIGLALAAAPFVATATGPVARALPLAVALALLPLIGGAVLAGLAKATMGRPGKLFVLLREFDRSRRLLCRVWPRFVAAVAIAAVGQILVAAEAWCLAQSQQLGVSFLDFAVLMPPVMLLVALPVAAGGWGVRESAMVAALALVGIGAAPALLLSVELGLVTALVSLPGGAIWLRRCCAGAAHRAPRTRISVAPLDRIRSGV